MKGSPRELSVSKPEHWKNRMQTNEATGPDPIEDSNYYEGISTKRVFAYVIDFLICGILGLMGWVVAAIVGFLSFGLLLGPLIAAIALIPIVYHTLLIGSAQSATWGMRFCGIRVYRLDGGRPQMLQAFIQTAVFFFTAPVTSFLILLVALFNVQRRCLHDMLAGTLVLNDVDKQ